MPAPQPRVLVADDDVRALDLTAALLGSHARVDRAAKPATALRFMFEGNYDLFITDLNMERPGDGLILAGAMRTLHPQCRIVLITGFPDFERSLATIQRVFDMTLIKPVDPKVLRRLPGLTAAQTGQNGRALGHGTIWDILSRQQSQILEAWLNLVEADPILSAVHLDPKERMDHMLGLVQCLASRDHNAAGEADNAQLHGRMRQMQHYRPHWVSLEISYLRRAVFQAIMRDMLELDLSRFPHDLFEFNLRLDADLLHSLRAFGLEGEA